jgi:hypothetical protein
MTATISARKETAFGSKRIVEFDVALGAYTGGSTGVEVLPASLGMKHLDIVIIEPGTDGYVYDYDYTNFSIKAYMHGGTTTVSATVSAPSITVSGASMAVLATAGSPVALVLSNATASGALSKAAATNRTIPLVTLGVPLASGVLATAPTFSAATAQGSLVEVASATLSTAVHCMAIGD